ncbi:hypothetical protein BDL97_05G121700 [Sphagnum fallax]|nr:hypothetical protein BDL97_05G121700 [Sphagnum fallax]
MVVTLLVRHLPDGLPPHTLTRLFTHYGASETRPCAGGRLKNCAFVDFNNDGLAARAQSQLHRLRFLGKTLIVERANPVTEKQDLPSDGIKKEKEEGLAPPLPPYPPLPRAPPLPSVDSSAPTPTVVSASGGESIAPTLGVDYPFPPHLEYAYPPPDGDILTNIVNCLIAVPRFYTQVLHLMNKMNIPAPFRPALPTPPLPPPAPPPAPPNRQEGDLSSGESELESSNEEDDDMEAMNEETKNSEEAEPQLKRAKKRAKREAIVGPAVDKTTSHEAAGVKPIHIAPKANLIRKNKPVLQIKIKPKGSASGGGSDKHSQDVETVADASIEEVDITNRAATLAELEAGKVAPTDILSLPMFKVRFFLPQEQKPTDTDSSFLQFRLDELVSIWAAIGHII